MQMFIVDEVVIDGTIQKSIIHPTASLNSNIAAALESKTIINADS